MATLPARVTSAGPASQPAIPAASLANVVDHVSRCAELSDYTRTRLRMAAAELMAADAVRTERDALRAEVDRLRRQGGPSSRLPATVSAWAS